MSADLLRIGEYAVKLGERLGADEAEAYMVSVRRRSLKLTDRIEAVNSSLSTGLGVRLVTAKRVGLYATTMLGHREVKETVHRAYSAAKVTEPDMEWVSLPVSHGKAAVQGIFDKETAALDAEKISKAALDVLKLIRDRGHLLTIVRGSLSTIVGKTAIVNSHGCRLERKETSASIRLSVKAEDGSKTGLRTEENQAHAWRDLNTQTVCKQASEGALMAMEAKQIHPCEMPVVWRNKLFASILRIMFSGTLSADSVQRGRSPWAGKLGVKIASEEINLLDNGVLHKGIGTREFDDEGIPQQKTMLVNKGFLVGYLYDTFTANKAGVKSTGNAIRSYNNRPTPAPTNLILEAGKASFHEIVEETKRGIYLEEVIGAWLSNPASGDLSATVTNAFLIEDGAVTKPVKGMLISGDFFKILRDGIDIVGGDLEYSANAYSPSVRVTRMTLLPA
jgi:PmbA protein